VTTPVILPPMTAADRARVTVIFNYIRLQLRGLRLTEGTIQRHLERSFGLFLPKSPGPVSWADYLRGLYTADWAVCVGCLESQAAAWELLFNARAGRSDSLLVDALRARAVRLYPRDEERQDTAVTEFWSNLIAPETDEATPVLARYDGRRPLVPWLIRVFQNWHLSKLRQNAGVSSLPDEDLAVPLETNPSSLDSTGRWQKIFVEATREWLAGIDDEDRLLLGLRWRYRLSQREAAKVFGLNEGTLTRRTDKLRDNALKQIGAALQAEGWTGDDLREFVLTELGAVLTDDPLLSADNLARILAAKGKKLSEYVCTGSESSRGSRHDG
jgi:hypothetical protein